MRYAGASSALDPSGAELSRNLLYALAAAAIVAVGVVAVVLIAGGGGGDEDPREVLDATFSGDKQIDSGVFDVGIEVESEGGEDEGKLQLNLGGPFQGADDGFPSFQVDAEADLEGSQEFSGGLGLISTGDSAFVSFQEQAYQVPQQAFNQFAQRFTQLQRQSEQEGGSEGAGLLSSLGINPAAWLTDLSNEGREDVDGAETIHVSGQADVPKLVEDLKRIAENAPQATGGLAPEQLDELDQLTELVQTADFDIYSGADDEILRRLDASIELTPPGSEDAPDSLRVDFSLTFSELNEPQQIEAPSDARPLGELLQQFGLDANSLGDLGQALGGGGAGSGQQLPQAGGAPQAPSDSASQEYLDCLATAEGEGAVRECAELLE